MSPALREALAPARRACGGPKVRIHGEACVLRCPGALWVEAERTLVASDLHLEKDSAFAARGQMLPPYDSPATLAKLEAEIEARDHDALRGELGDVLFVIANLARKLDIEPEDALRSSNAKFVRRFRFIEQALAERGRTPDQSDLEEMDALWDAAKAAERS